MRVELFDGLWHKRLYINRKAPANRRAAAAQLQASEHDRFAAEILDVQIIVRSQRVRSTLDVVDLKPVIVHTAKVAQAKLKIGGGPVPSKREAWKERDNENINAHENRRRTGNRCSVSAWRQRRSAGEDHDRARRDPECQGPGGQGPEKTLLRAALDG
jgi:hypothetical protein